ncbi:MAG: tryptophan synthase subunit alpha [Armatimonadetes bacterium]|nr:tryptophan synthase subunit alpha [Armatimonadota bacterium]
MTISDQFAQLKARGEKALVLFITAGDPDLESLPAIMEALQEAGADILEIGLPFSDPIADGPTIQASSQRALDRGVNLNGVFHAVTNANTTIPLVMMGYYNSVLRIGLDQFVSRAAEAGFSGTIMCDLIGEEASDWITASRQGSLDTIFLAAPTSTDDRLKSVCEASSGFVYAVSRTGVTGAGGSMSADAGGIVSRLRTHTDLPICVGFGISQPEQVREVCQSADGAVVGSWLVNALADGWHDPTKRNEILNHVRALKAATHI